jgi:ribosomal protein S30
MNPWVEHVRAYATKHKISYACAISEASKTYTKKTNKKETPKPTPEPEKKETPRVTNIFDYVKQQAKMLNEAPPLKISTETRTSAQIQADKKKANKAATQDSALKRRLVKKFYNPKKETKKEEKEIKLREKKYEEEQAKYLKSLTPEQHAIRDAPLSGFKKKKSSLIL